MKKRDAAKKMRSKQIIAVLLVITLLIGGIWALKILNKPSAPKFTGPVENISTGLIAEYAALILIAKEKGYFDEYGLNVTVTEYPSGPAALSDLLAGKLDTAMASDFAGVRNSFKNEDIRILANMSKSEAFFMIARADRGIKSAADISGKRIGITRKTVGEYYIGQFLTFNRLSQQDITVVDMPQAELADAVSKGTIDAAVLFEPNAYLAVQRLGDTAVRIPIQSGQEINSLLYSSGKLIRERPQAIERYLKAVVAAEEYVAQHNDEAKQLVGRRLKYDDAYIGYIWPQFSFVVSMEQELLLAMDDEAQWTIENKLTDAMQTPNYLRFIYLDGLETVKPSSITIIR
jgi:NitT/TauT family transport system substrate-binding protein